MQKRFGQEGLPEGKGALNKDEEIRKAAGRPKDSPKGACAARKPKGTKGSKEDWMKRAFLVFLMMAAVLGALAAPCIATDEEGVADDGYYVTGKVISYSAGVSITLDVEGEKVTFAISGSCAAPETIAPGTEVDVEVVNEKVISVTVF